MVVKVQKNPSFDVYGGNCDESDISHQHDNPAVHQMQ